MSQSEIRLLEMRLSKAERECELAFSMLGMNGVPRDRAKTVANGIDVLVTRLRSELAEVRQDAARWQFAYKMKAGDFLVLVSKAQKGHPGGLNALIDAAMAEPKKVPRG
jgi:hypothetical protein